VLGAKLDMSFWATSFLEEQARRSLPHVTLERIPFDAPKLSTFPPSSACPGSNGHDSCTPFDANLFYGRL
jgi:hypothetical protein